MRHPGICLALSSLLSLSQAQSSSDIYQTRFPGVTWDNTQWRLATSNLDQGHYQSRISIANGYHGINVAALGPFFEVDTPVNGDNINGWPLFDTRQTFATIGGFWDSQPETNGSNMPWLWQYGGVSVISGIPHWAGIHLDLGAGLVLDASTPKSTISNFSSTLDMKHGLMNWAYTWTPRQGLVFNIAYQMFAHRLHINQGFVNVNVTSNKAVNLTAVGVLNGDCAVRTTFQHKGQDGNLIYSAVNPVGIDNVTAYVYAGLNISGAQSSSLSSAEWNRTYVGNNESSIAQHTNITLAAGQMVQMYKFVGLASSDGFGNPQTVAKSAAVAAVAAGYATSLESHVSEWALTFQSDSVDKFLSATNSTIPSNLVEASIMAVVNPYQLLQQTITKNAMQSVNDAPVNKHSIAVGGLGAGSYAGQIYWDAEIWMQPGLVATFPFAGRGIANYRAALLQQAKQNVQTAYQSSKNGTHFSPGAAVFPWTSGRDGNCTAVGPCFDYEYHINGDIAQELANYWVASGDTDYFKTELYPIYDAIAAFLSNILAKNGSQYILTNMTDPDEYANNVDNGGFTMPMISTTLSNADLFRSRFDMSPNMTWTTQASDVDIARDSAADITLEYSSMNGSILVKQADVVLITYPLRFTGQNYTQQDSLSDLDYYALKQSPNGPGMTYAIFSIVANEASPSGCSSYVYQQYSEQPYARGPWFQLSEQLIDDFTTNGGTHPAYPFLTGHGGANQVVLFGYLGYRLELDYNLHIDPSLPPQIPIIDYRTFHWQGWAINATSNQTHTTLSRISRTTAEQEIAGAVPNMTYANISIPVLVGPPNNETQFDLPVTGELVVPNRRSAFNKTVPGNAAQCQDVSSSNEWVPGQFPIAAVDGALSTKWQPLNASVVSSITVSLEPGLKVSSMSFDWAQAPPVNYTVHFHNKSMSQAQILATKPLMSGKVNISIPYDAQLASEIRPYTSNTTTVKLPENVYTSTYATLAIYGSLANGNTTKAEQSGMGATVSEWNIVVADAAGGSNETSTMNERGWPMAVVEREAGRRRGMLGKIERSMREGI